MTAPGWSRTRATAGRPRALVFDLDGLLIASEEASFRLAVEMIGRHAAAPPPMLSREEYGSFVGRSVAETWGELRERYALAPSLDQLLSEQNRELIGWYRSPALMPGAAELVEAASSAGIAMAIASSAPGTLVDAAAKGMPIGRHFAAVVSADHPLVRAPKPAPDIYLAACELLQVPPGEALALEDSHTGALAACAAGLPTIGVPNQWTREREFPDGTVERGSLFDVLRELFPGATDQPALSVDA
jgi:HAD superfamily hydrolase (TIGR01509 family)